MENILIDTDIVIEYLRAKDKSKTLLIELMKKHDVSLTPITEFELFLGAKTVSHKNDLEMLFNEVEVMPFSFGCGEVAANMLIYGKILGININIWKLESYLLLA